MERVVLVAEDEPHLRHIFGRRLTSLGFRVVEANDGEQALAELEALVGESARVVCVLDIMMPKLDGLQLLRRIRGAEALSATPVVIASAVRDAETRAELEALGISAFLKKPFLNEELVAAVERAFEAEPHIVADSAEGTVEDSTANPTTPESE